MIGTSAFPAGRVGTRTFLWLLVGTALPCGAARVALGCTAFAMETGEGLLFGANFDNPFKPGLLYVNKRGVVKSGFPLKEGETPAAWTSEYGSVTIHTAPYQYPWAGMNEAGLVISTMQLDATQVPPPDTRPSLLSAGWVQYVLDTCATVEEIITAERRVRLNFGVDHYLACDAAGECLSIEFLEGKPVYHRGKDLPVRAMMAGWPYEQCFKKRRGGGKPSLLDGPMARVDAMVRAYRDTGAESSVDYAFSILKEVSVEDTTWSLVFDVANRVVHIRSCKNDKARYLALGDLDFSCRAPVMMLDVHARYKGDLKKHLRKYSSKAALRHAIGAVAFHMPDMTEETVRKMQAHMDGFACKASE